MTQESVRWVSRDSWPGLQSQGFRFHKHIDDHSQTEEVWEYTYLDWLEELKEEFGSGNVLLGNAFNPMTQLPDADYGVQNKWMGVYVKRP